LRHTAHATVYSWNAGSGDWFTAANWTPGGGPAGPSDDAVISKNGGHVHAPMRAASVTTLP